MSGRGRGRGGGRGRVRRQEVEGEDGWTVITHGLARLTENGKTSKKSEARVAGALPTKTIEGLTAKKLHAELKKLQGQWKDTAVARQVDELLRKKRWKVKEAVCIGIGSFSRDWEHRHRSMWQLVLFIDVIQHLHQKDQEITVYAQDPAFTPLDIKFLRFLNITTITTGIEAHITPSSFVFSPFVDWYILLPTFLTSKDLILYVGNEILDDYSVYAQIEDKRRKLEECNELGSKFLEGKERVKVREFERHAHALEGMVVYWKTTMDIEGVPT